MKMVFIEGGHNVNIARRNIRTSSEKQNIRMPVSQRESTPLTRFNMGQSMKLKKTGCGSCSGIR